MYVFEIRLQYANHICIRVCYMIFCLVFIIIMFHNITSYKQNTLHKNG